MKTERTNNFNAVAGVYDALAKTVFGKSIQEAQRVMLPELSHARAILIIGGGTGWLLEEVLALNQTAEIWYVDASSKMVERARQRLVNQSPRIRFVCGTENDLPNHPTFDAVVANFFFDMFLPDSLAVVLSKVKNSMTEQAVLIVTDFTSPKKLWHSLLLVTMYAFFRRISKLEARTLPPWQSLLGDAGFRVETCLHFYDGFIEARKYVTR